MYINPIGKSKFLPIFFPKKILKIYLKIKNIAKCHVRHGAQLSCSSRSCSSRSRIYLERTSKCNFWHNSRVNRRSFGKVMDLSFFKIIPLDSRENVYSIFLYISVPIWGFPKLVKILYFRVVPYFWSFWLI